MFPVPLLPPELVGEHEQVNHEQRNCQHEQPDQRASASSTRAARCWPLVTLHHVVLHRLLVHLLMMQSILMCLLRGSLVHLLMTQGILVCLLRGALGLLCGSLRLLLLLPGLHGCFLFTFYWRIGSPI